MSILMAMILGFLFGFILQKIGASNPQYIINMLRLKDFHLMKAILLGIGISSLSLFALLSVGVIDVSHVSIKSSYVGVIVGGLILGLGWALSGFCPGTGAVAMGAGRKDAIFFMLGGLLGAFAYTKVFSQLKDTALFNEVGGKMTLALTGNSKFPALLTDIPAVLVAGVIAMLFMGIAWYLPSKPISTK